MGDAAKPLLYCMFSKQVLMSFCLAGVPLRDIHSYSFWRVCKNVERRFCVTGAILLWSFMQGFRRWVACLVAGAALWRPPSSFCVAGAALQTCRACFASCTSGGDNANRAAGANHRESVILPSNDSIWCSSVVCGISFCVAGVIFRTLYTLHFTLYTLHVTLHIPHFTLHTLHCTLHTLHSTLYTPHFTFTHYTCTLHILHSTLYTLHSTLYTLHSTFHTLHSTLYTAHSTLYTPHLTLRTLHFTLIHFTLYTPHSTLHTLHSTLYTLHSTLHSTLHIPHFTLHPLCCTLHTLHFALCTLHSTLYTSHFTLQTLHFRTLRFTLCTLHSTLFTLHVQLYTLHHALYTSHFKPDTFHSTLHTPQSPLHTLHTTFPTQHATFFTCHTLHSTPFDCSNKLFQKCSTWLHSGSRAASCVPIQDSATGLVCAWFEHCEHFQCPSSPCSLDIWPFGASLFLRLKVLSSRRWISGRASKHGMQALRLWHLSGPKTTCGWRWMPAPFWESYPCHIWPYLDGFGLCLLVVVEVVVTCQGNTSLSYSIRKPWF